MLAVRRSTTAWIGPCGSKEHRVKYQMLKQTEPQTPGRTASAYVSPPARPDRRPTFLRMQIDARLLRRLSGAHIRWSIRLWYSALAGAPVTVSVVQAQVHVLEHLGHVYDLPRVEREVFHHMKNGDQAADFITLDRVPRL